MDEHLDLAEVSKLLELEPTSTQLAGEVVSAKSGCKRKSSGWFLESAGQVESRDSRDHFAWLLGHVSGKAKALTALASRGYLVDICCRWDSAWGDGGPTLDPGQMSQLGALGIEVWFDVYFDRESASA
jgi:hypothetical protein